MLMKRKRLVDSLFKVARGSENALVNNIRKIADFWCFRKLLRMTLAHT